MRRVVTGFDESGKSVFTSDGRAPHGAALRGVERFRIDEIWAVEGVPQLPAPHEDPTLPNGSNTPNRPWPSSRSQDHRVDAHAGAGHRLS